MSYMFWYRCKTWNTSRNMLYMWRKRYCYKDADYFIRTNESPNNMFKLPWNW